jgi:hypothetical protein
MFKVEVALAENRKEIANAKQQIRKSTQEVERSNDAVREAEELLSGRKRARQEALKSLDVNKKRQKSAEISCLKLKSDFEVELERFRKHWSDESASAAVDGSGNPCDELYPKDTMFKVEVALAENRKEIVSVKQQVRKSTQENERCNDAVREAEELLSGRKRAQQEALKSLDVNKKRQKCAEDSRLKLKSGLEMELERFRNYWSDE